MPYLTATVSITSDTAAQPQQIFQKILRFFVNQEQVLNITKAGGDGAGVYSALPSIEQSATLNALILAVDNPLLIKLASVAPGDGIISLKAGGLLMVLDGSLAAGAALNVLVNNTAVTGGDDGAGSVGITGAAGGT